MNVATPRDLRLYSGAVAAVLGAPTSGKSWLVKKADLGGAFPRRVVFDPYARRDIRRVELGETIFPWTGLVVSPLDLLREPELLDTKPLSLVVAPSNLEKKALGRAFEAVAELVWFTGGVDLIAEEAGLYSRQATDLVFRIASGGAHASMRLIMICQSLMRIAADARREAVAIAAFAQCSPQDIHELSRFCGKAFAEAVKGLRVEDRRAFLWRQGDSLGAVECRT